jgi:hypothetical protein
MRTLLIILLSIYIPVLATAQGTLQFNQARLLEGSQGNCPTCWTVPAGKVWKIGSVNCSSGNNIYYVVNNRQLGLLAGMGYAGVDPRYINPFPMWLPAGATFGYNGMSNNQAITFFALEFNIIP